MIRRVCATHRFQIARRNLEHGARSGLEVLGDRQTKPERARRLTRQPFERSSSTTLASVRRRPFPAWLARLFAMTEVTLVAGQRATRRADRAAWMARASATSSTPPSLLFGSCHDHHSLSWTSVVSTYT